MSSGLRAKALAEAKDFCVRLLIARHNLHWWQWRRRRCLDTLANEFVSLYKRIDAMPEDDVVKWLATVAA